MKTLLASSFLAVSLTAIGGAPALAQQQNCAKRDFVVQRLADKFGESRKAMGLNHDNALMEIFASEESGSWTITVTYPSGVTCLIASGQAYERLHDMLPSAFNDA